MSRINLFRYISRAKDISINITPKKNSGNLKVNINFEISTTTAEFETNNINPNFLADTEDEYLYKMSIRHSDGHD